MLHQMKHEHRGGLLCALIVPVGFVASCLLPVDADALPVFARKYRTACTTCHSLIPKLNQFGLAFRNNGYRVPVNDEKFIKEAPVELGAEPWKEMWPGKGVWPGSIPSNVPIALRGVADTNIRGAGQQVRLNFDFPNEFAIYTIGTLGESLSFLGEVEFKGGGGPPPGGSERIELSLLQLNFNKLGGTSLLNFRIGRFEPVATPFSRFYRRTTSADFNVSELQPVSGDARLRDRQMGLEFFGARTGPDNRGGIEWGVGMVNGTGTSSDNNSQKDLEWTVSYKLFGYGVTGPLREEPEELKATDNFVDNSLKIGLFGWVGRGTVETFKNNYNRVGVKFDAFFHRLNLYGAYIRARDTVRRVPERELESSAWFLEADYMLTPWIMPLIRYERTEITEIGAAPAPTRRLFIPAVNLALRANVRVLVEGRVYQRDENFAPEKKPLNEGRVRVDFVF